MGTLEPLAGSGPALAKPAENAALGSSLDTFLMTSILDIVCLALGGFSEEQEEQVLLTHKAFKQVCVCVWHHKNPSCFTEHVHNMYTEHVHNNNNCISD